MALVAGACSHNEEESDELSLFATINDGRAATRAYGSPTELQNTQFRSGTPLCVECFKTGTTTKWSNSAGVYTTTNGNGALSPTTAIYYPSDNKNIDIIAFYPSTVTSATTNFPASGNITDQTTLDKYRSFDLMYATKLTNCARRNTHQLTFNHALAQIIVRIQPKTASGVTASDINDNVTAVKIRNTVPQATVTITNTGSAFSFSATNKGTTVGDISILQSGATNKEYSYGLIVPQTVAATHAAKKDFITVTYAPAGVTPVDYTYQLAANTPFAAGTKYTYTFTLGAAGLELLSLNITDWASGAGGSQEFTL